MKCLPRGLYAITGGPYATAQDLEGAVAAALEGGAVMVQYRDKSADATRRAEEARRLRVVCRARGAPLVINDDVALAKAVGADGVHIGRDDAALSEARELLGPGSIIGISCYDDFSRAQRAATLGADYLAFGALFHSATKPNAARVTPGILTRAKRELNLPVVAIGGITSENGRQLIAAGADLLAVIKGLFGATDVRAAAAEYALLFR